MRIRRSIVALVAATVLWSAPASAQQAAAGTPAPRIADAAALRDAIVKKTASDAEKRRQILTTLKHPEARAIADELGLSIQRAETAVAQLQGEELTRLATTAAQAESQLAGGRNVIVISVTTLLLIIIIVLLIAD